MENEGRDCTGEVACRTDRPNMIGTPILQFCTSNLDADRFLVSSYVRACNHICCTEQFCRRRAPLPPFGPQQTGTASVDNDAGAPNYCPSMLQLLAKYPLRIMELLLRDTSSCLWQMTCAPPFCRRAIVTSSSLAACIRRRQQRPRGLPVQT